MPTPAPAPAPAPDEILHALAINGKSWDAVRATVDAGADMRSPLSESIAEIAIVSGRADVAESMLDHGLPPSASIMAAAAHSGRIESIRSMHDRGCPVDADRGTPPLVAAAIRGHREAADLLLDMGADPGTTPSAADVAHDAGHPGLTTHLLVRGCSPWSAVVLHGEDWVPELVDQGPSDRLLRLLDQAADAEIAGIRQREPGHVLWLVSMSMPAEGEDRPAWLNADPAALRRHAAACDAVVQRLVVERGFEDSTLRVLAASSSGQEAMYARAAALELVASPNRDAIQAAADKTHADLAADLGVVLGREAPAPTAERLADQDQQQAPTGAPRRSR